MLVLFKLRLKSKLIKDANICNNNFFCKKDSWRSFKMRERPPSAATWTWNHNRYLLFKRKLISQSRRKKDKRIPKIRLKISKKNQRKTSTKLKPSKKLLEELSSTAQKNYKPTEGKILIRKIWDPKQLDLGFSTKS